MSCLCDYFLLITWGIETSRRVALPCWSPAALAPLRWTQTPRTEGGVGDLAYPLVSDLTHEIARSFLVEGAEGVALRGLFVIDPDGVVQHASVNNAPIGRSVDEALRVLQAAQHVRAHPDEVCPANWRPGARTIQPTPEAAKAYFAEL